MIRKNRRIEGFKTTNDVMIELGLSDKKLILQDARRGRITAYCLPGQRGVKGAPYYFKSEDVEAYIQNWHMPQPVVRG